jgi:hypothetical protein
MPSKPNSLTGVPRSHHLAQFLWEISVLPSKAVLSKGLHAFNVFSLGSLKMKTGTVLVWC